MTAGRVLRGCSGLLAGGLTMLLVVLVGAWVASTAVGTPGPGAAMLLGHVVAVCAAGGLQRVADRRGDRVGLLASGGVLVVTVLVGVVFWWG